MEQDHYHVFESMKFKYSPYKNEHFARNVVFDNETIKWLISHTEDWP